MTKPPAPIQFGPAVELCMIHCGEDVGGGRSMTTRSKKGVLDPQAPSTEVIRFLLQCRQLAAEGSSLYGDRMEWGALLPDWVLRAMVRVFASLQREEANDPDQIAAVAWIFLRAWTSQSFQASLPKYLQTQIAIAKSKKIGGYGPESLAGKEMVFRQAMVDPVPKTEYSHPFCRWPRKC